MFNNYDVRTAFMLKLWHIFFSTPHCLLTFGFDLMRHLFS